VLAVKQYALDMLKTENLQKFFVLLNLVFGCTTVDQESLI